jgi:hypothetical protein
MPRIVPLTVRLFAVMASASLRRSLANRADLAFELAMAVVGGASSLAALGAVYTRTGSLAGPGGPRLAGAGDGRDRGGVGNPHAHRRRGRPVRPDHRGLAPRAAPLHQRGGLTRQGNEKSLTSQ